MYDVLAGSHASRLTLEDFGLLSVQPPAPQKQPSQKPKAKPIRTRHTAVKKARKPR